MRSKTILTIALCAVLLLGCEGTLAYPLGSHDLGASRPFHGIHGLGYDRDGRLLAGSVVGAATYAVDRESGAVTVALPAPDGMADDLALARDGTLAWTGFLSGTLGYSAQEKPRSASPRATPAPIPSPLRMTGVCSSPRYFGDAAYEADPLRHPAPRLIMEDMGGSTVLRSAPTEPSMAPSGSRDKSLGSISRWKP